MKKIFKTEILLWLIIIPLGGYGLYSFYHLPDDYVITDFPLALIVFLAASVLTLCYFLFVALCAFIYRPAKEMPEEDLPGCSIIVPAYNEGKHVADTLESIFACNYPADKMEITAINDGSTDDTWEWITKTAEKYPGKIKTIDLPANKGKKNALYQGIKLSSHDIIVTVDSDSTVSPDALRKLVAPFRDPATGAVAGNIMIKNSDDGIYPKLMAVSLMFGFEMIRSSQSIIGFVMCTPGALSAYRKKACIDTLDKWLNQRFLGAAATVGEDRALSSMILRNGYKVIYQRDAIAHTCMPTTFKGFINTLLRWARGDVRENLLMFLHMLTFFPKNLPVICKQFQIFILIYNGIIAASFPVTMAYCILSNIHHPGVVWGIVSSMWIGFVFCFIYSLIPVSVYARRKSPADAVWGIIFPLLFLTVLSWIPLWSVVTVRNSKWLTR